MPYLGDHTNGKHVFRILQMLCATEETIVRDTAVESASKIARQMSPADSVNMLSKAVKELSEANWFTPRVSACGLLPVMFERLNLLSDDDSKDGKAQCISIFTSFCNETMPMVRRAAAKVLSDFASKIKSNDMILNDVMPLITKLLHDESTAVQEITVEHIPTISKLMDEESSKKYMLPIVTSCVSSPSWRRRRAVARGKFRYLRRLCWSVNLSLSHTHTRLDTHTHTPAPPHRNAFHWSKHGKGNRNRIYSTTYKNASS